MRKSHWSAFLFFPPYGIPVYRLGLATAPLILSLAQHPDMLRPMLARRFSSPGDIDAALALTSAAGGAAQTRRAAARFADRAMRTLETSGLATRELEAMAAAAAERLA